MQSIILDVGGIGKQEEYGVLSSEEPIFRRCCKIHRHLLGCLHKISILTSEKLVIKMQGSELSKKT